MSTTANRIVESFQVGNGRVAFGLPFADYRASEGVSVSTLRRIHRSPAHYRHAATQPGEDSEAMLLGTIVHTALLEPWLLPTLYHPEPVEWQHDGRTKAGKAERAAWRDATAGRQIVPGAIWDQATHIATAVGNHPIASRLIQHVPTYAREATCWSPDPETGIMRRARPDLPTQVGALLDLKTTVSADPREFSASIAKWGYHDQAAQYLDVCNDTLAAHSGWQPFDRFVFVAAEKTAPYAVSVLELSQAAIDLGRDRNRRAYHRLAECQESDRWPDYTDPEVTEIATVDLPRWAYRQEECE